MVILDTNHISILERRGSNAYPLLARLAHIPVADVRVTVISYLPYTADAAMQFEALRTQHRRLSSPDLKIAAIALANDALC